MTELWPITIKKPKPGSWEPITLRGSFVGRISQPNAKPPYYIQIGLITNEYRTHAASFYCDRFAEPEICARIMNWFVEHVLVKGGNVTAVREWRGWQSPWIPGQPIGPGEYDIVLSTDPKTTFRRLVTPDNAHQYTGSQLILAHAQVQQPASPFANLDFT